MNTAAQRKVEVYFSFNSIYFSRLYIAVAADVDFYCYKSQASDFGDALVLRPSKHATDKVIAPGNPSRSLSFKGFLS